MRGDPREEKLDMDTRISRRGLLATGGKLALYGAAIGIAPRFIRPAAPGRRTRWRPA